MSDDLISRQAAIDAVDAIGHIATMPDGDKCVRRSAVKYTLSMLPPAQPEERTEKRTETRACNSISRQAAIDAIEQLVIPEDMCVFEILSHIELAIETLPPAQPERKKGRWIWSIDVRCGNCGYKLQTTGLPMICPNCGAWIVEGEDDATD